jgi:5-methylcytosine-specific restriction enzyme A
MPLAPARVCSQPGCATLVYGQSRCAQHRPVPRPRPSAAAQGYGADWRRTRTSYLTAYPYCADCGELATDVDHQVSRHDGGGDEWGNLVARCHACHSRVTAKYDGGFGNQRKPGKV